MDESDQFSWLLRGFDTSSIVLLGSATGINLLWKQVVSTGSGECGSASRMKPQRCAGLCQSVRIQ